jgi:hypothetical protein
MARTKEGRLLTDLYRRRQLALRAETMRDVIRFFRLWELKDPATYAAMEDALLAVAHTRGMQAAVLAANYYQTFRAVEVPEGKLVSIALAAPAPDEQVRKAIAATARAGVLRAIRAGQPYEQAMANGLTQVSGSISRIALNRGRETIEQTVKRDPAALGYARVTDGQPCAFCAMLASRGPVYKEETVSFREHDHCTCGAEPHYPGSDWPGRAREFRELWNETGSLNSFRSELGRQQKASLADAATAAALN